MTTKAPSTLIAIIASHYGEDDAIATVIHEILTEEHSVDFDEIEADAKKDFAENPGDYEGQTEEEVIEAAIINELDSYSLDTGRGQTGDLYELDGGGMTFLFGTDDEMEQEAIAYVDDMIDQDIISMDTIKASWERGQTRAEWCEEAVRVDGVGHTLNSYDGSLGEVSIKGEDDKTTWYNYVRTN